MNKQQQEPRVGTPQRTVFVLQQSAVYQEMARVQGLEREDEQIAYDRERGGSVILTTAQETQEFIADAIRGVAGQTTKAYGKIGAGMAGDIQAASSEDIDVAGWYLELVPDDLHHSYEQHIKAKRQGNIDLTEQDFLNIPDYIDSYDDVLSVNTFKTGDREVVLGKKINGYSVIMALISNKRKSLHFKNMWGLDTPTYEKRYGKRGGSTASHPGRSSVSANDPPKMIHGTSSKPNIPQPPGKVKLQSATDTAAGLGFQQGLDPGAGRITQMKATLQGGVEAAAPEPSSPLETRLRQERGMDQDPTQGPDVGMGTPFQSAEQYSRWLKDINAQTTTLDTVDKYREAEYNNSPEYQLLRGYAKAVEQGDISPLIGFDQFAEVDKEATRSIVGKATSTGVVIESAAPHCIARIIGQVSTPHSGMRQGISIEAVLDALQNPVKIGEIKIWSDGDIRQKFKGKDATVTISLRDKRLIQANPRR